MNSNDLESLHREDAGVEKQAMQVCRGKLPGQEDAIKGVTQGLANVGSH